jgi:hypothetical protein
MTGNEHDEEPPDESETLEPENEAASELPENARSGTDDIDSSGRRKPSQSERRSSRFWLGFLLRR